RRYAADPDATGCLVLEGAHCNDKPAREAACEFYIAAENLIRTYVAMRYPQEADRTTDFMGTLMAGLSAKARAGYSLERLQESVLLAGDVLERLLPD
ncbi:TetR/AcrR family transcriptional regulator, partial [Salmonella enterica subsp. enterica serovar Enteritidis]|nr:TetR/AcrR family transcriptional regulator [Salmonella enterica subsp. enterica serovar Enteritidis]MDI4699235.1 TetR/AcrR family transcriptional regulator [Salmonella enterica subsp. enterica serovar Cerro]HAW6413107.1 TetR/AcrR family transcriptional regulator [Salmonella enterica subsp. enterica serovar Enteritidis]